MTWDEFRKIKVIRVTIHYLFPIMGIRLTADIIDSRSGIAKGLYQRARL